MTALWIALSLISAVPGGEWPAFRGDGTSRTTAVQLPVSWNEKTPLAWKAELPGYGQSSPVIWRGKVFVTSVSGEFKEGLIVSCFEAASGKLVWKKEFRGTQKVKSSTYVSRGAPTPAVDAERVYLFFESGDLLALDHAGTLVWQKSIVKEYGEFQGNHGVASSVGLTENSVIVLVTHAGPSYLAAFAKRDGKLLWKTDRPAKVSWSSPIVVTAPRVETKANTDQPRAREIIVSVSGGAEAYSAADGKPLWSVSGITNNTVASPSITETLVVIGSSAAGQNVAIRRGGTGDISKSHVAWRLPEVTSSFASPLLTEKRAYFVNRSGVVQCVDVATGKTLWTHRLKGSCWASPVLAGGRVFFFSTNGATAVFEEGEKAKKISENELTMNGKLYGVAATDGMWLIRTGTELLAIRGETKP